MSSLTFNYRLLIGNETEDVFEQILIDKNIKYKRTKSLPNYTQKIDLEDGDFILYLDKTYFVDVKNSSISKKSLLHFKGHFFIVYDKGEWYVFNAQEVSQLKIERYDILPSGDLGVCSYKLKPHCSFFGLDDILKV